MLTRKEKVVYAVLVAFLIILVVIIGSGRAGQEHRTYLPMIEKDGTVRLSGQLLNEETNQPVPYIVLRLAEVYRTPTGDVYVLDMAFSPGTYSDKDGYFDFINVIQWQEDKNPAEYVLVVQKEEGVFDVINAGNHPVNHFVWVIPLGTKVQTGKVYTEFDNPYGTPPDISGSGVMEMEIKNATDN